MKNLVEKIVAIELANAGKEMATVVRMELASLNQQLVIAVEAASTDAFTKVIGDLKQANTDNKEIKRRLDACKSGVMASIEACAVLKTAGFEVAFSTTEQDVLYKIDLIAKTPNGKTFFCQVKTGQKVLKVFLAAKQVAEYVSIEVAALLVFAEKQNKQSDPFVVMQKDRLEKANADWALLARAAEACGAVAAYLILPKQVDAAALKAALGL